MKKLLLPFVAMAMFTGLANAQNNVGIGTNNPQTKLQVEGAISSTPVSGIAGTIIVVPANVSIFRITTDGTSSANNIQVTAPKEGQYLTIYNTDEDNANLGGYTVAATTGVISLNYINGGWRLVSDNTATGNGFIKNQTTQQASSNFNISGNGTVGGTTKTTNLQVTGGAGAATLLQGDASGNGTWTTTSSILAPVNASIAAETARATAAETALSTNITNEVTRATSAEAALNANISAEAAARAAADAAETAARIAADNTLTTNLNTEVTRATAAEATKWSITGNAGTSPSVAAIGSPVTGGSNFIGTTDAKDLVIATNNGTNTLERMRVTSSTGNVGIGTNAPDASAVLDIASSNKGLNIPHVALVSTISPIAGTKPDGLMVYNTSTTGTYPVPGVYTWDATAGNWVRIINNTTLASSMQPLTNTISGGLTPFSFNGSTATNIGIANQGVVTGMIANDAVTSTQILNGTITSADLSTPAVNATNQIFNTLPIANGGTGTSSVPANGNLLIGNGSSYNVTTLTAGSGIGIANAAGSITLSTTGAPPTGAAGGSLAGTYPNPTIAANAVGAPEIASTTVVAGSYGSTSQVGTFTVDADGRLTSAANATITPASIGMATHTPGTGLSGSAYNGTTAQTWNVAYGSTAGTAVQGNTTITITPGTGISGGGTITEGTGGTLNLANTGVLTVGASAPLASSGGQNPSISLTGIVPIANGGTNTSTVGTAGTVIYSNGTQHVSTANSGATNQVLHGSAAGAPTFSQVALTTDVTGVLPVANGGTGSNTQGWVDLTTAQTAAGAKTWSGAASFTAAGTGLSVTNNAQVGNALYLANTSNALSQGSGTSTRITTAYGYLEAGPQNASWMHFQTDRPQFYFNKRITVDEGIISSYAQDLNLQTSATTRMTILNSNGNVGIGISPSARFHVAGGGAILGTLIGGSSSNTRTLTIQQDGQAQINFGSYPGAWTSAFQLQNNDNTRFLWMSPLDNASANNARLMAAGTGLDFYVNGAAASAGTLGLTITSAGNVGVGTTAPGFKLHVPSGYIGTDYINTTDNSVGSGVTGIMVKAGDNYHRTATAAAVLSFLGVTAPTGDNLGNHTATTTLNMNYNSINHAADIIADNNYGQGLVGVYSSTNYQNVFSMGTSWRLPANGTTPGNLYGLAWTHSNVGGQSKSGLSHQLLVMENGVTKVALGSGIWTNYTSYMPFIYDVDNTGYYLDPSSSSNVNVETTNESYTNGWFRNNNANLGLYSQAYGNHWYANSSAYWNIGGGNGTNTGITFRNGYQGAIQGYTYSDGSGFGLLHSSGGWAIRTTPSVTEAYQPFYASTSYIPFIYDRDNTGYYCDPNSTSRMYFGDYNYLHTQVNDSWFPYTGNNWNYFRGNSYICNAHWYDENNTGYYFNPDNTNRLAYLYYGIGAYNVGGWMSGITQTENTSDGHQYLPLTGDWGYVGTSGQYWYYSYAMSHVNMSQRSLKRNITPLNQSMYDYVMNDIDKIKPSFYKMKDETDEMQKGNEAKYRPNMHLGVILDESPDYLQDQAFSGIDIYAMATMGVAGVKYNREEIKQLKEAVGVTKTKMTISDFGNEAMNGNETWVSFSDEFTAKNTSGVIPVVTVTSNVAGVMLSVTETKADKFKVVKTGDGAVAPFNWIAMAKVDLKQNEKLTAPVSNELMTQLKVDESRKAPIKAYWHEQMMKNQAEHARQVEEDKRVVAAGEKEVNATKNYKPDMGPAERAAKDKLNYTFVPANEPEKYTRETNVSKEGAPKVHDLTPTPTPVPESDKLPVKGGGTGPESNKK